jgi:hypothetical protein
LTETVEKERATEMYKKCICSCADAARVFCFWLAIFSQKAIFNFFFKSALKSSARFLSFS